MLCKGSNVSSFNSIQHCSKELTRIINASIKSGDLSWKTNPLYVKSFGELEPNEKVHDMISTTIVILTMRYILVDYLKDPDRVAVTRMLCYTRSDRDA